MKQRFLQLVTVSLFSLVLLGAEAAAQPVLQSGVPFDTWLNALTFANAYIEVPAGATRLTISVRNGAGDLDLYLKYGAPLTGTTVGQFRANADAASEGLTADETIVLTLTSVPPLREGRWYVATLNLNSTTTTFTLTATVEVPPGPDAHGLPVPAGQQAWVYPAVETCQKSPDPAAARPMSVGAVATGADTLTIRIETKEFTAPVDLYFGIFCRAIDPVNIYLLTQSGLRPVSEGLAPWRAGVSGPLSENLFGDVPTTVLRPGSCDLYLVATPAGRIDRYYFWNTSFMVKPLPEHVSDGSADFFDGTVVIPNAQILYQGQYHDQMASVPHNTLVGIMREGKAYLYHTSMGNVPLSDDTTRKAIGRLVMDFQSAAAPASAVRSVAKPESLNMDSPVRLKTGITLTREGQQTVLASNDLRRWAAVKGTDGTKPVFLPPLGRYFDDNVLRMIGTQIAKKYNPTQTWFTAYNSNQETITFSTGTLTIETYGATWRTLPMFIEGAADIANTVAVLFGGQPNPVTGVAIDGLALRDQKDAVLGDVLDTVDVAYVVLEAIKALASTLDTTEIVEIATTAACNFALYMTDSWASGKTGTPQSEAGLRTIIEDFINDLIAAGGNATSLGTAFPLFTLIDGLNALDYIVEGVVLHDAEVIGTWAYDEVRMEGGGQGACNDNNVNGFWAMQTYSDTACTNTGGFPAYPWQFILSSPAYKFYEQAGGTQGTWVLSNSAITMKETYGGSCTYSGTIDTTCKRMQGTWTCPSGSSTRQGCWIATR